jgi:hypothetical protein
MRKVRAKFIARQLDSCESHWKTLQNFFDISVE